MTLWLDGQTLRGEKGRPGGEPLLHRPDTNFLVSSPPPPICCRGLRNRDTLSPSEDKREWKRSPSHSVEQGRNLRRMDCPCGFWLQTRGWLMRTPFNFTSHTQNHIFTFIPQATMFTQFQTNSERKTIRTLVYKLQMPSGNIIYFMKIIDFSCISSELNIHRSKIMISEFEAFSGQRRKHALQIDKPACTLPAIL